MIQMTTNGHSPRGSLSHGGCKRTAARHSVVLPARLTWKDHRGTTRFATVVTKDVSDRGVYVECHSVASIPLHRIVHFQFEKDVLDRESIPAALRQSGRVLSAVYRVKPPTREGGLQGFALRLMIDPKRWLVQDRAALSA